MGSLTVGMGVPQQEMGSAGEAVLRGYSHMFSLRRAGRVPAAACAGAEWPSSVRESEWGERTECQVVCNQLTGMELFLVGLGHRKMPLLSAGQRWEEKDGREGRGAMLGLGPR